jgi:hypothetical protein
MNNVYLKDSTLTKVALMVVSVIDHGRSEVVMITNTLLMVSLAMYTVSVARDAKGIIGRVFAIDGLRGVVGRRQG